MEFILTEIFNFKDTFFKKNTIFKESSLKAGFIELKEKTGELNFIKIDDILSLKNTNGDNIFQIFNNNLNITKEEIDDDDDNHISNWRICLDVKTTRKKLKEVERLINLHIKPIL